MQEEDTTESNSKATRDSGCFESSEILVNGREEPKTEASVLREEPGEETEQLDCVQQKLQDLTVH